MDFFSFVIVIVAIGSATSVISSIANAVKPKIRRKDIEALKAEIRNELSSPEILRALPEAELARERLDSLEEQVERLGEENSFLKRLIEKDE